MSSVLCPICKSDTYKNLPSFGAICKHCGFVFQKQYYSRDYYHNLPCHFPEDYDQHAMRRAKYIVDFIPPKEREKTNKFLDVGCGKGKVLEFIQGCIPGSLGWGCTLGHSDTNIMRGDVEVDNFYWRNFDLIVLCHVVEHFLTPVETLKKVVNYLSPTGIIYIEVPSFHWVELRLPSVWTPEHLSYFTVETLTNTLAMAGLKPVKVKESKYWGNIKMICKRASVSDIDIKKVDYHKVLCYHSAVKLMYPWYRWMRKHKTIGPND